MNTFSEKIINWYIKNKRDLPWRNTRDAYLIWLSEIILQQTRVEQGMEYYLKFASEFPTVKQLAKADNEKVMKLWQGLGYYSRARNLHATAKMIVENHNGKFPNEYSQILSLKGIGEYTAAAIASFAFDKPHAVVDGNVYRVLARVFGIKTPIDTGQGKKEFSALANELLNSKNPALHNQAIMEFGALHCKPLSPDCKACVLNSMCFAYENNCVSELPIKAKTTKVRNRYFYYLVLRKKGIIAVNKRLGKDIWTNLYDFPMIETSTELSIENLLLTKEWKKFFGKNNYSILSVSETYRHILSHQRIFARFIEIDSAVPLEKIIPSSAIIIKEKDLEKFAVPKLIDNYLMKKK